MRIAIDLQPCQSLDSGRRGIGRYSLSLAKAMLRNTHGHDLMVMLNAAMPDGAERLRSELTGLVESDQIFTWQGLESIAAVHPDNFARNRASAMLREDAVAQMGVDLVHTVSLFEGWGDDVSVAVEPGIAETPTALTLYDLIPLVQSETYLADRRYREWYEDKIVHLRRAHLLLCISEHTMREAAEWLEIDSQKLVNISAAADPIFRRLDESEISRNELMRRYGIKRAPVVYAGGFDSRKNLPMLVKAYARLTPAVRAKHQLVLLGAAPEPLRDSLIETGRRAGLSANEVIFPGYVPDIDLVRLFNACELYVFPSLHEGFGLPALEAMACGAIVIGSNATSLPEVIGLSDALFDPRDLDSMANKIEQALTDQGFRRVLKEHGLVQPNKFTWSESARRALDALEKCDRSITRWTVPKRVLAHEVVAATFPTRGAWIHSEMEVVSVPGVECEWAADAPSIAAFDLAPQSNTRLWVELDNRPACAKLVKMLHGHRCRLVVRDTKFGEALAPLTKNKDGKQLLASLIYESGGYPSLATLQREGPTVSTLDRLVEPHSFRALGDIEVYRWNGDAEPPRLIGRTGRGLPLGDFADRLIADGGGLDDDDLAEVAASLSWQRYGLDRSRQLLVDVSNLFHHDAGTGIQRVVKAILGEMLKSAPVGYRVEPVVLGEDGLFRYARSYVGRVFLGGMDLPEDDLVEFGPCDMYLGLDLGAHLVPRHLGVYRKMSTLGIRQYFVVYDLLPVLRPDCFDPEGLDVFRDWYDAIAEVSDGVMCISKAVADEFVQWLEGARPKRSRSIAIGWFHLGADLQASTPVAHRHSPIRQSSELPRDLSNHPTFLMVGTLEPRKGHAQALDAFEQLWRDGINANFIIIGRTGWLTDSLIERINSHPELGARLFWLRSANDSTLLQAYEQASALLVASEGEGFGLPLIEAARHGLPLLVRDLPVFRELAGDHAHYFEGMGAADLAAALVEWLKLNAEGVAPKSGAIPWLTWSESCRQMLDVLVDSRWMLHWEAGRRHRYAAYDRRFHTQVGQLRRGQLRTTGRAGLLLYGPGVSLLAGEYAISVRGRALSGQGQIRLDVLGDSVELGSLVVDANSLVACARESLIDIEIANLIEVDCFAVRVTVDAGCELYVEGIDVDPIDHDHANPQASAPQASQ